MPLTIEHSYQLLREYGVFVRECCERCSQLLGPVRYTRSGDSGVWCSRECRDGAETHAPGTCWSCGASLAGLRRGTRFCSDTCRKRGNRKAHDGSADTDICRTQQGDGGNGESRKSQTTQISRDEQLETHDLRTPVEVLGMPAPSGPKNGALDAGARVSTDAM